MVIINPVPLPPFGGHAYTNITPFTYRDGWTFQRVLEELRKYIRDVLVPLIDDSFESVEDYVNNAVSNLVTYVDTEISGNKTWTTEQIANLTNYVNEQVQLIINDSIQVQDPVVAGIMNDESSDTRTITDELYSDKNIQTIVETGRLSEDSLNSTYTTIVELEARTPRILRPEMFGAVGDGVTDDSAALVALVAAIRDGDSIIGDNAKTYVFETPLNIQNVSNIEWSGGRYLFTRNTASTSGGTIAMRTTNVNNSVFTGMYLEQKNQTPQYTGFSINSSDGVSLIDFTVYNFRWIGLASVNTSKNTLFRDCIALRCRFGSFVMGNAAKVLGGRYSSEWSKTQEYIEKAGVWDETSLYYDGIIVGEADWILDGVTYDDNGQSGVYGANASRGIVSNCLVFNNGNKGIDFGITAPEHILIELTVIGNIVHGNKTGEIHFANVSRSVIKGNIVSIAQTTFGIGLNGNCSSNIITDNIVRATTTEAAIFINRSAPASTNNAVFNNSINASVPYNIDTGANAVMAVTGGTAKHYGKVESDISGLTGFAGRAAFSAIISDDNTFGQFITNKPIRFADGGGTRQQVQVGGIESSAVILTQRGNTASRPSPSAAGSGAMYYDNQLGKPIWSDGSVWKDSAGTTV